MHGPDALIDACLSGTTDMPQALFFSPKLSLFTLFDQKRKIDLNKKKKHEMTNQKTAVWEKRHMGNVLLIIIFVIRNLLPELSQSKIHFTEKK